jgi:hypothetical protein
LFDVGWMAMMLSMMYVKHILESTAVTNSHLMVKIIIMFYNDLWEFLIDPPYFGYNSAEQENLVLRILTF